MSFGVYLAIAAVIAIVCAIWAINTGIWLAVVLMIVGIALCPPPANLPILGIPVFLGGLIALLWLL